MGEETMKATIIQSLIGVLGFDENNQLVDKILFSKDPKPIAEKMLLAESGKALDEAVTLVQQLAKKGYTEFVFENAATARAVEKNLGVKVEAVQSSEQGEALRSNLENFATEVGFADQPDKLRELVREVSVELTRLRVRKAGEKRDLMIAQAILSIDDLDRTVNLFMGRAREWYGLHFPELDRLVEKHETYSKLVLILGRRENFTAENLEREGLSPTKAGHVAEASGKSMGAELTDVDIQQIQNLCKQTLGLYDLRRDLQGYADSTVEEVAPNVQTLVGSLLAARLIALVGGLTNLAKKPASTIQVLGAEKALFRSLKTGARPPKHGIIFQDTMINEAKKWQRGKISRALAGKLAIAARTDAFSGRYIGDSLKIDLEKRIGEIKEKYQKPPPPREREPKRLRPHSRRRGKERGHRG
jgi:nucleolar protein 56